MQKVKRFSIVIIVVVTVVISIVVVVVSGLQYINTKENKIILNTSIFFIEKLFIMKLL